MCRTVNFSNAVQYFRYPLFYVYSHYYCNYYGLMHIYYYYYYYYYYNNIILIITTVV